MMGNIITEADYSILVERVLRKEKMPRRLIADFLNPACRSMMGRYMARIEQNYQLGARILETVIHKKMTCEEDAWCLLDYAVCLCNLDGDEKMGLIRVNKVNNWAIQNEKNFCF